MLLKEKKFNTTPPQIYLQIKINYFIFCLKPIDLNLPMPT